MSLVLEVNSTPYDNFLSGKVEIRLDVLCNTFHFVAARSGIDPLPFRVGDSCRVLVNDEVVLTGTIEILTVNWDSFSHEIEIAGRDNTSDLLDSSIDELSDLGEGATLKKIIEAVVKNIGSSLVVVDDVSPEPFNAVNDIASPESGDNAFSFLEKVARQRQSLMTSDGDSNVVISRGGASVLSGARIQNSLKKGADNNVVSASVSYDNTGRYNFYKLTSQGNPSALDSAANTDLDSVVSRSGGTLDNEIRSGRTLVLSSESSFSDDDNFNRATWEANIRRARGRLYTAKIEGFTYDGKRLWELNKLVDIVDIFCAIYGQMLINSIVFSLDKEAGEQAEITFVEKSAYSLDLQDPDQMGDGFV